MENRQTEKKVAQKTRFWTLHGSGFLATTTHPTEKIFCLKKLQIPLPVSKYFTFDDGTYFSLNRDFRKNFEILAFFVMSMDRGL